MQRFASKFMNTRFMVCLTLALLGLPLLAEAADLANIDIIPEAPVGLSNKEWMHLCIGMFGGLAFMLYGIEKMGTALKVVAGDKMKQVMWRLTSNRFTGLLTGIFVTAVVQSSTVTTVLLVGFISTRLMSLAQSIGVILGADIGTTITAQILAFKVSEFALVPVCVGFLMMFLSKKDKFTQVGHAVMGIGLIFFGISLMSQSMYPLRTYDPFINVMADLSNPLYGIIAGAVFTALTNSSAAALAVVIALASQGLLTLDVGIGLTLGANLGTCLTAGIVAIGKNREAVRAAAAHVLFKLLGVILIFPFIGYFAELVTQWSPKAPADLQGVEALAYTVPRQVANAHTFFNVGIAMLFLPFTTQFARFLTWAIPDKPLDDEEIQPLFLDEFLISTPVLALQATRSELARMGNEVIDMYDSLIPALFHGSRADLKAISKLDEDVDSLYAHIVTYLGKVSGQSLTEKQTNELLGLTYASHHMESIGDVIEINFVNIGLNRLDHAVVISDETEKVLMSLTEVCRRAIKDSIRSITELDRDAAERVIGMKRDFKSVANKASKHLTERLTASEKNRLNTFSVEMDVIDKLQRIYFHAARLSKCTISILDSEAPKEAALKAY